jgi:agmatine deiminase
MYRPIVKGILFLVLFSFGNAAQPLNDSLWFLQNPHSLPQWLTEEEKLRLDEIGKGFTPTDPPTGPVWNIAEFEAMEAVLIRYPLGIPTSLIKEMAKDLPVMTLVSSSSDESAAKNLFQSAGINMANCHFYLVPTNSYWTRDYGPWWIVDGNGAIGIVNFPYNRPRPADDNVPVRLAQQLGVPLYGMNVVHTGGNYMTDGEGISASSDLVYSENNSISRDELHRRMENYLGVHSYHAVPDPNNTYIDHIDCWGKFLAPDKVLIRKVPRSHAQYDEIEETAAYFSEAVSSYGRPFEVWRVDTPQNQPYTNSLILNHKVFVPITNSSYDAAALEVYRQAMPGYEVHGFTGSWQSTDALHCRTKGIADRGMLRIRHIPPFAQQPVKSDSLELTLQINAYSGEALIADSLKIWYRTNITDWQSTPLCSLENDSFFVKLPLRVDGDSLFYCFQAADSSGRNQYHPFIGKADPHLVPPEWLLPLSLSDSHNFPNQFEILKSWPNPVNNTLSLSYKSLYSQEIKIGLYALNGALVSELYAGAVSIGDFQLTHNFDYLPSGIYFLKASGKYSVISEKICILK